MHISPSADTHPASEMLECFRQRTPGRDPHGSKTVPISALGVGVGQHTGHRVHCTLASFLSSLLLLSLSQVAFDTKSGSAGLETKGNELHETNATCVMCSCPSSSIPYLPFDTP